MIAAIIASLFCIGLVVFALMGVGGTGLFSASPAAPSANGSSVVEQDVSFFNVPLVCNAAPSIGCGSRAKFIMLDLMKDSTVEGAWLNRKGTVMAVVWNKATSTASHRGVLKSMFSRHELPVEPVSERDRAALAEDFKVKEMWYKGSDVDALSIEEAGVIADRILAVVSNHAGFRKFEDRQAFREEVKAAVQSRFLALKSFDELDATPRRMELEVARVAEKYFDKGKLPGPEILRTEYDALRENDECCSDANMAQNGAKCSAKEATVKKDE